MKDTRTKEEVEEVFYQLCEKHGIASNYYAQQAFERKWAEHVATKVNLLLVNEND